MHLSQRDFLNLWTPKIVLKMRFLGWRHFSRKRYECWQRWVCTFISFVVSQSAQLVDRSLSLVREISSKGRNIGWDHQLWEEQAQNHNQRVLNIGWKIDGKGCPDYVCLKSKASHWVSFDASFAFYNFNETLPVKEPTECFSKETNHFQTHFYQRKTFIDVIICETKTLPSISLVWEHPFSSQITLLLENKVPGINC